MKKKIAILISGNGTNMESIIRNSLNGYLNCDISLVFSSKPYCKGIDKAIKLGISVFAPNEKYSEKHLISVLQNFELDYIILAGFLKVLSKEFVGTYKVINIHPADTKLHQGLNGYEWAFENKLESTKITIHYVDVGLDTGKIISQKEIDLKDCNTLEEIKEKGLEIENKFYSEILREIFKEKNE